MQKQASPAMIVVAILVAVLVVSGIWWKFLGPGSQPSGSQEAPLPGAGGQTGGGISGSTTGAAPGGTPGTPLPGR